MEQILEKLFESVPKVRLLRLFMQNLEGYFTFPEIVQRTKVGAPRVKTELTKLLKIGLVRRKVATFREEIVKKSRSKKKPPKIRVKIKKAKVYYTSPEFPLLPELQDLVVKASVASRKKLLDQIKRLGNVKLAVLSGVFAPGNVNSRTDILIVGDNLKKKKLDNFFSQLESDMGKALSYTVMDINEFKYRLDMYDRFLRDILEYPHDKLVNRLRM